MSALLQLRPYQIASIEALREGARQHRSQILCAPTGSGKTVVATHLMSEAASKMSRAVFVCDRVALVDQTSAMFDAYGIAHGVLQAQHWRTKPWERIQIASAQTLARRGWNNGSLQLLVWDECHTLYRSVTEFIQSHQDVKVIGLSATPFTRGIGQYFTNVVNVATTDQLIDSGFLVPLKAYAGKAADMTGAKLKNDGEWQESEAEKRGLVIIGDIVSEWTSKTMLNFGGPVKTIVFTPTVAYGEELCRRFQEEGHNFQQVSYKDGNDDSRKALIEEFRKSDSDIMGLVSCEALAKGFDVPDIMCGIGAKPYRKSLSGHIQQMGRVMRPYDGKTFALWLDHSGNFARFMEDTAEIFSAGVSNLADNERDARVRKELDDEEKERLKCGNCRMLMSFTAQHCPHCGWERPKPRSTVTEIDGSLHEISLKSKASDMPSWASDKERVWRQLCHLALQRKNGDVIAAEKFAKAQYRSIYNTWPRYAMRNITPELPCHELVGKVQSLLIAWHKRKKAA